MKIEYAEIKASNKSDAKTNVDICLHLSGFTSKEFKFGKIKKISENTYEVEIIFKGDKGVFDK